MARLIVEKGHEKGKSIPLAAGATTVFGRDNSANVQIKDTMASRMHFKIEPRAEGLWLVDLESLNGTLVNGHPVREGRLNAGDLIRVGETTYSYLADDAGADPLIGQRLGGYQILERVGRGGMGTVYKAEQVDLQRIVALKIISEEHLQNKDFVDLFVHEARAAAKLNHPNIVQVYDVKKSDDQYYFSMEFVPGGSVQDLLNIKRKVPIDETVRMILEAARGLDYAHRKEIIHRDVKPDNFMIGEGGSIKIGDLGLAQRLGERLVADNDDTVIGTPHYIAPEQVLGRPADVRSDVYALGSTMYRMIAGFTPFQAPSVRDLVNRKAREEATPLHVALPDIPGPLGQICARMMARLPEQRTASMAEVIKDLEAWSRSGGGSEAAREAPAVSRKLLGAAVGLLAVVVVGGVIGAMAMLKKNAPPAAGQVPAPAESGDDIVGTKFDRAVIEESKLDDRKPESFDEVIRLYEAIASRWPGTSFAQDADKRREALSARRLRLMAARGFAALDDADREAWKQLVQTFQGGREDLAEARQSIQNFRAFAGDPAWKGTDAAAEAERRAAAISAWIAEVERRKAAYESVRAEADKALAEHRYKAAWETCHQFLTDLGAYSPGWKDRYTTLLYDVPARRFQERIVEQAGRRSEEVARQATELEKKGDYAGAIECLQATARESLPGPAKSAKELIATLQERWGTANKLAAERAAEEQRRIAEADRRDFDGAARRWRELVLRFDPKAVLAEAEGLRADSARFPRLPATEARIAARLAPLRLLAEFKELLIRTLNEKTAGVSTRITLGTLTGTIERASDDRLTIAFGSVSQSDQSYAEILGGGPGATKAGQFLDYLRGAGKSLDARWARGVAILAFELGLYERALDEIKAMERFTDEGARRFVAEYRPLAEELRYSDSDENEAQKHFDRLAFAVKEGGATPRFDVAKALQILRSRFAETALVAAQKSRLDEIEKERADRDEKERGRAARADRYRKISSQRGRVQSEMKFREAEITRAIQNIRDPLERSYTHGESQLGFGDLKTSTQALLDALDQGFKRFPVGGERRNPNDPVLLWVSRSGGGLMRNFHLQKQEGKATEIRNRVDAKFEEGPEFWAWSWAKTHHDSWTQIVAERQKKHGEKLATLERELQENPDPKILFDLAEAHEVLRNFVDVRGLSAALIAEFPAYDKVKNGEALHRLAEAVYQMRDVVEAERLFSRLKSEHPTHPKVIPSPAFDSVDNRIKSCNELKNKMGLQK